VAITTLNPRDLSSSSDTITTQAKTDKRAHSPISQVDAGEPASSSPENVAAISTVTHIDKKHKKHKKHRNEQ
jgi:hypothetical protein